MERAIQIYAIINFVIIGLSHMLRPRAWVDFFIILRERGEAGVFATAFISLIFGSIVVAFHNVWSGIPVVLTIMGWAQVVKAFIYFVFPAVGLRKLQTPSHERAHLFVYAGIPFLVVAALLGYHVLAPVQGHASPAPADTGTELQRLTQQRFDANAANDRSFYERLLAPSFLLLEPHNFPPKTKKEYLEAEFPAGRAPRPKSTLGEFQALVSGDTAVVSYQVVEPYPIGGEQHFELVSRRLDTYVRIEDAWRLLSMAIAEPPSWPDVASIDPRLYAEYSGTYQLSPEMLILVTNEAGRLMAQVTGQDKVELFPENTTTFFDRSDSPLARTVFERDTSGKVVAQTYRAMGQKLRARKVR